MGFCLLLRQPCQPPFSEPEALRPTLIGSMPYSVWYIGVLRPTYIKCNNYARFNINNNIFFASSVIPSPDIKKSAGGKLLFLPADKSNFLLQRQKWQKLSTAEGEHLVLHQEKQKFCEDLVGCQPGDVLYLLLEPCSINWYAWVFPEGGVKME